jgi:hypothetical protein
MNAALRVVNVRPVVDTFQLLDLTSKRYTHHATFDFLSSRSTYP